MKRNCNLELQLSNVPRQQEQQLTIFYAGQMCVCDATEMQARAIIWEASRQAEQERYNGDLISPTSALQINSPQSSPSPSSSSSSLKRSLQRFLQKRKHRLIASSPYHNGDPL